LEFRAAQVLEGKRLLNHVIRIAETMDQGFCGALCFMEHNCVSYNYITTSEIGKCELNNATYEGHEKDLQENPDYVYHGAKVIFFSSLLFFSHSEVHTAYVWLNLILFFFFPLKNPCASGPCSHKMICQTGFTHRGYRCICPAGFMGQDCKIGEKTTLQFTLSPTNGFIFMPATALEMQLLIPLCLFEALVVVYVCNPFTP